MSAARDVLIIGGGVNGLTCAAALAKAGQKPLVLEAQNHVGGGARTEEIAPGFKAPILAHTTGPFSADVAADLDLRRFGVEAVSSDVALVGLGSSTGPLVLYEDRRRTAEALRRYSTRDADAWPGFVSSVAALGRVIGTLYQTTPASVDDPSGRDLWSLLRTLRAFRSLDKADAYRLLRWGPMPVADLVGECLEHEGLRAVVASDGILGTNLGPRSAGSGMVLLLRAANEALAPARSWFVRGGPGALSSAIATAVRQSGGEIRTNAPVRRIIVENERARGVVLADGTELSARAVISAIDPKQTFLRLCDPIDLAPEFLWRMRNYRVQGTLGKVNLALSGLPSFSDLDREALTARLRIAPDLDYLERAFDHSKYGRWSPRPYVEFTMPTLLDPTLAPQGAHVLSAYVQFAPYRLRESSWQAERDSFARAAVDAIDRHAPGLRSLVVAQHVITPDELEQTYGFTGGHIFHGELALDQLLTMRPLLGWGQYRAPIHDLYLCSSGTHPGTGLTGLSGANAAREVLRDLR